MMMATHLKLLSSGTLPPRRNGPARPMAKTSATRKVASISSCQNAPNIKEDQCAPPRTQRARVSISISAITTKANKKPALIKNTGRSTLFNKPVSRALRFFIATSFSLNWITLQYRAQRRLQGLQIRFEMTPLIHASSVNRLPYLLGTRGSHGTFSLVKLDTGWLKFQSTKI